MTHDAAVYTGRAAVRAGILVTGTEVLTGIISDRNGPWLSERLLEIGVDVAMIEVVGDRPEDLLTALQHMAADGLAVIVTSGGLGPTADDLTAEIVGRFSGREMVLDAALEERIAEILKPLLARWPNLDRDAIRESNRKQAVVPQGATVLDPVGTAPGLVVPPVSGSAPGAPTVVVLPGPPRELQPMWETARQTDAFRQAIAGATEYRREILRLFGIPESEIANTLRAASEAGLSLEPLEITTCLRRGEIEIATRFEPAAQPDYEALAAFIAERHSDTLFSRDGSTIDDQVVALLEGRTIAVAESCTGGLMAARLTDRAGASEYFAGGVVAYSNQAKSELVGVDPELIAGHGAVSVEVARALAEGAAARFAASVGVGITGIAGPGGGTEEKPVGFVCFSVCGPDGRTLTRSARLPGGRADIRDRSTTVTMHMIARLLGAKAIERVRLFVALDLPGPARDALEDWQGRILRADAGLRRVAPEAMHVTLCFLGMRSAEEVPVIAEACAGFAGFPAAAVALGQPVWLPARGPRVLAVALVDLAGHLAGLQRGVADALVQAGVYAPEARGFFPHVTVARVRRDAPSRGRGSPPLPPGDRPEASFRGDVVTLYRSQLRPGGAAYQRLRTISLAAPSGSG